MGFPSDPLLISSHMANECEYQVYRMQIVDGIEHVCPANQNDKFLMSQ